MNALPKVHILDLNFMDVPSAIASFLVETNDGLVLIETGPATTFDHLKSAIAQNGFDWKDVKHVLLTHIHFDHAGAAWKFAENNAKIYVHPIGLPHLQNPEKLWNSAKRIYKDKMEQLWGKMEPINKKLLIPAGEGDLLKTGTLEFQVHYTPGHAIHHNAYQLGNVIFTGDVAGIKIGNGPVQPPCPPPDINIENWKKSIQRLKDQHPELLYLTHFGKVDNPGKHLSELEKMLDNWAKWIKPYFDNEVPADEITSRFIAYTANQLKEAGVPENSMESYERANPSWMSVNGLLRYWKLKKQGRI